MALLGWALSRWALLPVQQLSLAAHALGPTQLASRLSLPPRGSELYPLAQAFNGALDRLESAFHQLETFSADVAHELRSPLGTLIGTTEVALSRSRSADELSEVLAGNLADLERLAQLVRDMLFLARADHGERAAELKPVAMRTLAEETAEFFQPLLEQRGIGLSLHGDAQFTGNTGLLKRALSNLIANAIQYGDVGQPLRVDLAANANELTLCVVNHGPVLSSNTQQHMFDRFYRADSARSRESGHVGLGLAIVQAVARMHGDRAFVRCQEGQVFTGFSLPAQPS
jgi:two-component system heavy metal sensor histidine kinase CusS